MVLITRLAEGHQALKSAHEGEDVGDRPQEEPQHKCGQEGGEEAGEDRPGDEPPDGRHMLQPIHLQPQSALKIAICPSKFPAQSRS